MSNDVFFLGAGFSIALANLCVTNNKKYPSLKKLTDKILDEYSKISLATHLREISSKYKKDIEQLLTYLSTDLPWQNQQMVHLDKALYFEIVSKIGKYFNELDKNCKYNFEPFQSLAKYIIENKVPLITLNYDILLEKMLFSNLSEEYQKANSYREFYKQPIMSLYDRKPRHAFGFASYETDNYGEKLPAIHKLHGSINWLWSATNPTEPIYFTSGRENENLRKDLMEYIIPPVLDKSKFYNHNIIKSIWADAYTTLKNAERIFIIGFSFPPTDLSVQFLFNSVICDSNKKPKIYVINTKNSINPNNTNYLQERYNKVFAGLSIDYTYCCNNSLEKFIKEIIEVDLKNSEVQTNI